MEHGAGGARAPGRGGRAVRRRARSRAAHARRSSSASAVSNFGVRPAAGGASSARPRRRAPAPTLDGSTRPVDAPFSALVFKVQANMDPRHRDRVAFLRVCSGRFERGMRVDQRPHRQAVRARPRPRALRRRARDPRRGLPGRRRRARQRRRAARRRHAVRRPGRALRADPHARARALRDGAQPRHLPPQAVPPRAAAARRGGRRARASPRAGRRIRHPSSRASARCSSRSRWSAWSTSSARS